MAGRHGDDEKVLHAIATLKNIRCEWKDADRLWRQLALVDETRWLEALKNRALIAINQQREADAVAFYEEIFAQRSHDPEAAYYLIGHAGLNGEIDHANALLAAHRKSVKDSPDLLILEAGLALIADDEDEVGRIRDSLLNRADASDQHHLDFIDALIGHEQHELARSYVGKLATRSGLGSSVLDRAIKVSAAQDRWNEQLELVNMLLAGHPEEVGLYVRKCRILAQLRNWYGILDASAKGLKYDSKSVRLWSSRVRALRELNLLQDRDSTIEKGLKNFSPKTLETQCDRIRILLTAQRFEQILEESSGFVKGPTSSPVILRLRAKAQRELGDLEAALSSLRVAVQQTSDDSQLSDEIKSLADAISLVDNRIGAAGKEKKRTFPTAIFEAALAEPVISNEGSRNVVFHVNWSLGPGGGERQLVNLALAQVQNAEIEPVVVARSLSEIGQRNFFQQKLDDAGITVLSLENKQPFDLEQYSSADSEALTLLSELPGDAAQIAVPLFHLLKLHRPRVLHLWQDLICVAGGLAGYLAGIPTIILSTRSSAPVEEDRARHYFVDGFNLLAEKPQVIMINNSVHGARTYEHWLGAPEGTVEVLTNGYDSAGMVQSMRDQDMRSIRETANCELGSVLVGGVMRLTPEKRPDLWVETLIELVRSSDHIRGILIGIGAMRPALEERIRDAGFQDRICLVGTQSPVEPWLAAMDLLFLSSSREGLPNVLVEAQAMGTPVIATDVGGAGETFENGVTGQLVDSDCCAHEIAVKILAMINQPGFAGMGARAQQVVGTRFSIDNVRREVSRLYSIDGRPVSSALINE